MGQHHVRHPMDWRLPQRLVLVSHTEVHSWTDCDLSGKRHSAVVTTPGVRRQPLAAATVVATVSGECRNSWASATETGRPLTMANMPTVMISRNQVRRTVGWTRKKPTRQMHGIESDNKRSINWINWHGIACQLDHGTNPLKSKRIYNRMQASYTWSIFFSLYAHAWRKITANCM